MLAFEVACRGFIGAGRSQYRTEDVLLVLVVVTQLEREVVPRCGDLIVTPGIEGFDLFRRLAAVVNGDLDRDASMSDQARFDTYPASSSVWDTTR